jgi:hypothetical protein
MWYNKIVDDMGQLPDAIDWFQKQLETAWVEAKIIGSIERAAQELSGIMAYRFGQLQEVEAILKHLNIRYDKMRSDHYRRYLERYQRELTDRSIEKYIDGEDDVVTMATLINEVALVRNKYLALIKGLEQKSYNISNIIRLRVVGMETVTLDQGMIGS